MNSEALVQLALDALSCNQKELGLRLGVSPTQVSKWKKGEHMSHDMEKRLRELSNIGERSPEFVVWAGSLTDADKWARLIEHLAECACLGDDTGYDTLPLKEDLEQLCRSTFHTLMEMGVVIPNRFPEELEMDYDGSESEEKDQAVYEVLESNPYASTIRKMYDSLTDVYGFYAAYVSHLVFDGDLDLMDTGENIESCLLSLAASKIDVDAEFAPNFSTFRSHVRDEYKEWIDDVKVKALRAGVPVKAELSNLIYESNDALGHEAEAESLGFNDSRIHPDVYMNELLVGMRVIHQVLPAILKKLGLEEEFQLDQSELRLGR